MIRSVTLDNSKPTLKRSRAIVPSRKSKSSRRNPGVPRAIAGIGKAFPEKLTVTHKYAELIDYNVTTKSMSRVQLKCNGMFDPYDPVGGHQPLYFDSLTPIYNHYVVTKSKIKVTFMQNYPNAAQNPDTICTVTTDDDTSTTSVLTTQLEIAPAKQVKVCGGNEPKAIVLCNWSAARTFGSNPLDNPRLQGTASADPTELSHYNVTVYNNSGVAPAYMTALCEIEYTAVWFELKTPTGS